LQVRELLAEALARLGGRPAAELEASVLLGRVLNRPRAWLYAHPESEVESAAQETFRSLVARREAGEPVAYLTGAREFWSLPLQVTPDVLIPRPETELLVEIALQFVPKGADWRIADLGTGSGALALAIASERPRCEVHATESSPAALEVARANAERLAPGRVHFHVGSWLEPLSGRFRLIVSNPPYVAADDPHLSQGDCRFEPRPALTPGEDALSAIRQIVRDSIPCLEIGGMLAFEHGFDQAGTARELMRAAAYRGVTSHRDLEGRERVTSGIRAPEDP
jgi:release factor glutamine methyltransferase